MKIAYLQPSFTISKGNISFAIISHGCKGYFFPFATMTDGCKEANFIGLSHEYDILDTTSWKIPLK